jgi:transcriptional regulator with XRE-family HTH domain
MERIMGVDAEHIVGALRAARQEKGLSQRELSAKAGVPQGHISKIESGAVDLKLSSLIALARVLGLEIVAVPRKTIPAVQALTRARDSGGAQAPETARIAARLLKRIAKTAGLLNAATPDGGAAVRLQRAARELAMLPLEQNEIDALKAAAKTVGKLARGEIQEQQVRDATVGIERLRNNLVHRVSEKAAHPPRPAYSLEDGDDDA